MRYGAVICGFVAVAVGCSGSVGDAEPGAPSEVVATSDTSTGPPTSGSDIPQDATTLPAAVPTSSVGDDGPPASTVVPTTAPRPSRCGEPTGDPAPLRVWHGLNGDVGNLMQILVARFEEAHPGTEVELVQVEGYPAVVERLSQTPETEWPDVVMSGNLAVRLLVDSDRFVPLVECTAGAVDDNFVDLYPAIERLYTVDGTLWAAPLNVSAPVLIYDGKRWERAGLDPADPPGDFDEFEAAIRQLRDSGEATTGAVLYDRSALWLVEQAAAQTDQLVVEPANGRAGPDVERVRLATPQHVATLERFRSLFEDGYLQYEGVNTTGLADLERLIRVTDPSGSTLNSSAVLGDVIRLFENGVLPDVDIGVGPMPGPGAGSTLGGGALWLVDRGDPGRVGASWQLVEWFTRPAIIAEIAAYTGYLPTTPRAAADPGLQTRWAEWPELRVAFDQMTKTPDSDAGAGLQVGPMTDVLRAIETAAVDVIVYGADPMERLTQAEVEITNVISVYGESLRAGN